MKRRPKAREGEPNPARKHGTLEGFFGGLLFWFLASQLGLLDLLPVLRGEMASLLLAGVLGALLGATRARWLGRAATFAVLCLWLVVAFSPLALRVALPLKWEQTPEKADAVVVLQAGVQQDDDFGSPTLERTLHALELVHQGLAPRLVLTEDPTQGSHQNATQKLMKNLGLGFPVFPVGPVRNTHDEAVQVSALMKQKGWTKILLVTSPTHSRRAALTFTKTGLRVVSTPNRDTLFDLEHLDSPLDRVRAFGAAMREIVGLRLYRARGWA